MPSIDAQIPPKYPVSFVIFGTPLPADFISTVRSLTYPPVIFPIKPP